MGESKTRQKLSKSLRENWWIVDLLVPFYYSQVQAKTHQTETNAHPNEKTETAGTGLNRPYQEKGIKKRQNSWGQGPDSCKYLTENRGITHGKT